MNNSGITKPKTKVKIDASWACGNGKGILAIFRAWL